MIQNKNGTWYGEYSEFENAKKQSLELLKREGYAHFYLSKGPIHYIDCELESFEGPIQRGQYFYKVTVSHFNSFKMSGSFLSPEQAVDQIDVLEKHLVEIEKAS